MKAFCETLIFAALMVIVLLVGMALVGCESSGWIVTTDVLIGQDAVGATCAFTLGVDKPLAISIGRAQQLVRERGGGHVCVPSGTALEVP